MNKILLDIFIPAADAHIEMKVLPKLRVKDVIDMLQNYIARQPELQFVVTEGARLCDYATGRIYNISAFLSDLNLGNGAVLMLV